MKGAIIILIVLIITGVTLWLLDLKSHAHHHASIPDQSDSRSDSEVSDKEDGEVCCGLHAICEKKYAVPAGKVVYYDDEELDALAGRDPLTYTEEELTQLNDVIATLAPADAAGWHQSLRMRNISLPEAMRDELIILISEAVYQKKV